MDKVIKTFIAPVVLDTSIDELDLEICILCAKDFVRCRCSPTSLLDLNVKVESIEEM